MCCGVFLIVNKIFIVGFIWIYHRVNVEVKVLEKPILINNTNYA